jgi:hypothetical protein
MQRSRLFVALAALVAGFALGCSTPGAIGSPGAVGLPSPTGPVSPNTPLTDSQRAWVDRTFASLSLRDRVGQMVMIWMLGD